MIYNLTTVVNFGKYKGMTIEEVIKEDTSYLRWCMSDKGILDFELDNQAYKKLEQKEKDNNARYGHIDEENYFDDSFPSWEDLDF